MLLFIHLNGHVGNFLLIYLCNLIAVKLRPVKCLVVEDVDSEKSIDYVLDNKA